MLYDVHWQPTTSADIESNGVSNRMTDGTSRTVRHATFCELASFYSTRHRLVRSVVFSSYDSRASVYVYRSSTIVRLDGWTHDVFMFDRHPPGV